MLFTFALTALIVLAVGALWMIGDGSIVSFGSGFALGASPSPSAILGLISVDDSELTVNQVKMGALDDTTRLWSYKCGRIDGGELSLTYEYRQGNYTTFVNLLGTDDLYYSYVLVDGGVVSGRGNISSLGKPTSPEDDRSTFSVKVKISTLAWAA